MPKEWKILPLLILVLIAASFLRLYSLNETPPGLYSDEAMNGNNALEALATGDFKVFYPENNGREGFFMNIQALFLDFFKTNEPWVLRLPSALFGILTVLGIYFLTKELFGDKRIALLATFLMAVSFWHVNFSRIAFRAIMAPAFLTWGLYFLLLAFRKSHFLLPLLGGLVYGLGMHSYIAYRATPLLIILALVFLGLKYGWKRTLKIGAVFVAVSIIVFLPLGLYFLENPGDFFGRTAQISVWQSSTPLRDLGLNVLKTAGMFNIAGDWNPRHNIPSKPLLYWPVGILFVIGVIIGVRTLFKKTKPEKFGFGILVGWLIVAALPTVISNEGVPHALRAILMVPPVFILAAVGGVRLYEIAAGKLKISGTVLKTTALILSVLLFLQVSGKYFIEWKESPTVESAFNKDIVEIGREINRLPAETPKYIVIDTGSHNVREIGTPAQTIMFITDTFLPNKRKEKNTYYISPSQISEIPENSYIIKL